MTTLAAPARAPHLTTAARIILGLVFVGSGLGGLLGKPPTLTSPPLPEGLIALFEGMVKSGYLFHLLKLTELSVGVLLVANRFVPLALTILAPVVVNIVAFHLFLMPAGLPVALVVLALNVYLAWAYRDHFRSVLVARASPSSGR
jgi:uncharacterized membrane protein YphA (DoxX/SURF4 family)